MKTALFGNRRNQRFLGPQKAEAFCGETWERKTKRSLVKKRRKEEKKAGKNTKIILYVALVIIVLIIIFDLGKPASRDDDSFLGGLLKSIGLSGAGVEVVACNGSNDCSNCVEKCGITGYCVPSGKKICAAPGGSGDTTCEARCPCKKDDKEGVCDDCTEECEDISSRWIPGEDWRCVATGMKKCPNGACVGIYDVCTGCSEDAPCESSCYVCSGSPDYTCGLDTTKFIVCRGGCCPIKNSAGEEMKCCEGLASAAGVCCKKTKTCAQTSTLEVNYNYCGETEESCEDSGCTTSCDYLCSSALGSICCDGSKYTGCKAQDFLVPTCTKSEKDCVSPEKVCREFGLPGSDDQVLCCAQNEDCVTITVKVNNLPNKDIKACAPTSCPTGKSLCTGLGDFAEATKCCSAENEFCHRSPNGVPLCALL